MRHLIVIIILGTLLAHTDVGSSNDMARRGGGGRMEMVWSPDGTQLAVVSHKLDAYGVWLYDTADLSADPRPVYATEYMAESGALRTRPFAAFSPDGTMLAAPSLEHDMIQFWDSLTLEPDMTLNANPTHLAFSPNGTTLAGIYHGVTIWDLNSDTTTNLLDSTTNVWSIAFSPISDDDIRLAAGGCIQLEQTCEAGGVWVWTTQAGTGQLLTEWIGAPDWVTRVSFNPNGRVLMLTTLNGQVWSWSLENYESPFLLYDRSTDGVAANSVAYSPDGMVIAVGFSDGIHLLGLEHQTPELLGVLSLGLHISHVAYSPDGSMLAAGTATGDGVFIFDVSTSEQIAVLNPQLMP